MIKFPYMEINQIKSSPDDPGQGDSGYEGEVLLGTFFFFGVVLTSDLYFFVFDRFLIH